jgi:hypothetical protein
MKRIVRICDDVFENNGSNIFLNVQLKPARHIATFEETLPLSDDAPGAFAEPQLPILLVSIIQSKSVHH